MNDDDRFTLEIPKSEIKRRGKLIFLKRGHTVYTPENIDRKFAVQLTKNCFSVIIKTVQFSSEEQKIIKKEREREIRKRNTSKTRKNQRTEYQIEELELEQLINQKENLAKEKENLKTEIYGLKANIDS